ncbi:hypothetical protein Amet_2246 [Alkaliphilus metalliredigens QYMF]|uniref:Lipoprotein n=1 Tax=Alkaliphilus metalliredigens (strain QYMF) TaxID=293826 RepID=A6TQD6_ALKMQ|nr:hypothetical protein [Alkaliphilus metalliredigens]ABR48404.1 hypothetical protein Amet_2246 [Alkaliphilus metalliredigens QYMF]
MRRKKMVLTLMFMALVILVSCSSDEKEYTEYSDGYIAFNYPADWNLKVNESHNNKQIFFGEETGFQFVIDVEEMNEMKSEYKIKEEIEKELSEGYELAEEMVSVETISYQENSIEGEWAKELNLEVNLVDSQIELLYQLL